MTTIAQRIGNVLITPPPVLPLTREATDQLAVNDYARSFIQLEQPAAPVPSAPDAVRLRGSDAASSRAAQDAVTLPALSGAAMVIGGVPSRGWTGVADKVSAAVGTSWAFGAATASVIIWLAVGPPLKWNDTWQLIMNTAASIIAYLMVFLLQTAQNRDTRQGIADLRIIYSEILSLRADLHAEREAREAAEARVTERLKGNC